MIYRLFVIINKNLKSPPPDNKRISHLVLSSIIPIHTHTHARTCCYITKLLHKKATVNSLSREREKVHRIYLAPSATDTHTHTHLVYIIYAKIQRHERERERSAANESSRASAAVVCGRT